MDMDFKTATDLLGLSAPELAEAFGLQPQTVRQMRLAPNTANFRNPPNGWQKIVVRLAKERGKKLRALVEALEHHSDLPSRRNQ
jgi:hypothetical protein